MTDPDPNVAPEDRILDPPPAGEPYDALHYVFTTRTTRGARAYANALGGPGEVWELEGAYYPVRRHSEEAGLLLRRGANLIPPEDDELHMDFDRLLIGLQRIDNDDQVE